MSSAAASARSAMVPADLASDLFCGGGDRAAGTDSDVPGS